MPCIREKRETIFIMEPGLRASMCKAASTAIRAFCLILAFLALVLFVPGVSQAASKADPNIKEGAMNRLADESSPYLLKHATNPVNWYPWGREAFEKAKKEDKPIFLSIGYSTCHWCNVMEEESFSDPEVAALMNKVFVSIKVDREERPDIDSVYMSASMLITGSGGWPLTILMTPDKKPFFAATYIPKTSRFGRVGLMEFIPTVSDVWENKRQEITRSTETIFAAMTSASRSGGVSNGVELGKKELEATYEELKARFDTENGGFGRAPKFPSPHALLYLLRYQKRSGQADALHMVETTLRAMRAGGIYDHLGFGFHRYSTDGQWLVPHFEKMLYDQAMLAMAYTEGYQVTGREEYARTAREIFSYVMEDMTSPEGGFYSALDADTEGEEGRFYMWRKSEIEEALGMKDAGHASRHFNIKGEGNFIDPLQGAVSGQNILHIDRKELSRKGPDKKMEKIRKKLLAYRQMRERPFKDDKVLTDWNGLMIAALAKGSQALGNEAGDARYAGAARRAADFVLASMRLPGGGLAHRWRGGQAGIRAGAEDYAYLIWGLVELYEAVFDPKYLEAAVGLSDVFIKEFRDEASGGFFLTADSGEKLITRPMEVYDGAVPSYNSVAMYSLLRLSRLTGNASLEEKAHGVATAFSANVRQMPSAHTMLMSALDFAMAPSHEVVIVGKRGDSGTRAMLRAVHSVFAPGKVVVFVDADDPTRIRQVAKFTEWMNMKDGKATAYVCTDYVCNSPTNDVKKMLELLGGEASLFLTQR